MEQPGFFYGCDLRFKQSCSYWTMIQSGSLTETFLVICLNLPNLCSIINIEQMPIFFNLAPDQNYDN